MTEDVDRISYWKKRTIQEAKNRQQKKRYEDGSLLDFVEGEEDGSS